MPARCANAPSYSYIECTSNITSPVFLICSKAGALLNLHYPLRLHKAFLINAPSWWSVVWRMVSPLIDKNTRELMSLFSIKVGPLPSCWRRCRASHCRDPGKIGGGMCVQDADGAARAMLEWIDADVLPNEYGGESTAGGRVRRCVGRPACGGMWGSGEGSRPRSRQAAGNQADWPLRGPPQAWP